MSSASLGEPLAGSAPGAWLRATAIAGALATTLAVASGELQFELPASPRRSGRAPALVAVAIGAVVAHRSLLPFAGAALALTFASAVLGAAVRAGAEWVSPLHLVVGTLASGAALGTALASMRAYHLPAGAGATTSR